MAEKRTIKQTPAWLFWPSVALLGLLDLTAIVGSILLWGQNG